jgi:hypothetical protein
MNIKPRKLLELKLHTYLVLYKILIQFMKIGLGSILAQETLIIVANYLITPTNDWPLHMTSAPTSHLVLFNFA